MSKKKNKVPKITEEQYYAYIAGLKNNAAPFSADGKIIIPPTINCSSDGDIKNEAD